MDPSIKPQTPSMRRGNFAQERELLLMKFPGIFKNNIAEYAQTIPKLIRKRRNIAR